MGADLRCVSEERGGSAAEVGGSAGGERDPVRVEDGVSVVFTTERLSPQKHGASFIRRVAVRGGVGADQPRAGRQGAGSGGAERGTHGGGDRCAEREKCAKRGEFDGNFLGYDSGKQVWGRKRHRGVDTQGHTLDTLITAASVQDRDGAKPLLRRLKQLFPSITKVWADGGYAGKLVDWAKAALGIDLVIVNKLPDQRGFVVLPRRWVVERSFAWSDTCRRLSKDYEGYIDVSRAFNLLASIHTILKRLSP
jgi:transposase